jgi:general secretion pathway protein E
MNQRLIKTLCQGCAHKVTAGDALELHELNMLGIDPDSQVRRHNATGCDLCNRTGIMGRTLLLDALLIPLGPSQRDSIYNALMTNVNSIVHEDGVIVHTRREGLVDLVLSGLVDPKAALSNLEG